MVRFEQISSALPPQAENRPIGLDPNFGDYPKIRALLGCLDERESFKRNPILWWEPGVVGYAEDGKTPIYEK